MPNPKADFYFNQPSQWQEELIFLRSIISRMDVTEEVKWRKPCYTQDGRNIVLLHYFKDYCALMFFKGALLADKDRVLVRISDNTQAARHMRFTNLSEIKAAETLLLDYIADAIAVEKSGRKLVYKNTKDYVIPLEFQTALTESPSLAAAFAKLTPGRQRGYLLHFSNAKHAKTRIARIEKYRARILDGFGLDDTYGE